MATREVKTAAPTRHEGLPNWVRSLYCLIHKEVSMVHPFGGDSFDDDPLASPVDLVTTWTQDPPQAEESDELAGVVQNRA